MKEFRIIDEENNVYGEFDNIVMACKESVKLNGTSVLVMDLKNKTIKETLSKESVKYLASR